MLSSFYKNIVLFFIFFFQFACGFSGQSLFESFADSGYNFFLGMPPRLIDHFEKDLLPEAQRPSS